VNLYDVNREESEHFRDWLSETYDIKAEIQDSLEDVVTSSSLILFATTALEPHLHDPKLFEHTPTVLHLSLRDLGVDVVLASQNVVDDIEHCMKAKTSMHLAETATGNRDFVAGTLVDFLEKKVEPDDKRPRVFSPFGLGVLDLAVGDLVLEAAKSFGDTIALPDFFSNSARW